LKRRGDAGRRAPEPRAGYQSSRVRAGNLQVAGPRSFIYLLVALFLVRSFIYASFIPPWQGPDEPLHYDYARYLQLNKKLPVLGKTGLSKKTRLSLISFYFDEYANGRNPYAEKKTLNTKEIGTSKQNAEPIQERQNQIVQHPPLYYFISALILSLLQKSSLLTSIWILRMFSALFGLGVVILTYLTVNLLYEKNKLPAVGAAAFVALNPMSTHVTTIISNDSLINLLFAAFIYLLVKSIKKGFTEKRALATGVVVGLGLLTKFFFFLALPVLVMAFWLFRKELTLDYKKPAFVFLPPLVLAGAYYFRNISLYGTLQPSFRFSVQGINKNWSSVKFLLEAFRTFFISFWSNFGWQKPTFFKSFNLILFMVCLLALVGLGKYLFYLFRKKDFLKLKILGLLGIASLLLTLTITFYAYKELKISGLLQGTQGRYLFSFIGIFGLLLFLGLRELVPFKDGRLALTVFIGGLIVLDISAIFYYILPYFYQAGSSVFSTALQASQRAAADWFRLGPMYLASILAYLALVIAIIFTTVWSFRGEKI